MLRIFTISSFLLLACVGPSIHGYTISGLSSVRGQEYSGGYRTGGFVGTKDAQSDYSENAGSHGYSVVSGSPSYSSTTGSTYGSDSGYADSSIVGSGSSGSYDSANAQGTNSISVSPYPELRGGQTSSSELVGASYSTGGSPSGGVAYSTGSGGDSRLVGQVTSGLVDYSESSLAGGHNSGSHSGGLSIVERGEYSSPQQASSPFNTYTIGGPKAAAYVSSSSLVNPSNQASLSNVNIIGSYSSNPSFTPVAHRPHVSSPHSAQASGHPSHSSPGLGFATSASSLKNFLPNVHGSSGHNYLGHVSSHRGSPSHHPYAAASNPSPGYTSRGPGSGYFTSNSPYRGNANPGGKIFVVKDNSHHAGHAYPGEHHGGYNGGPTFVTPNSGYKMRNVGSASSHGPPSFPNGYSTAGTYNVASSLASPHIANKHAGSFFGFL